MMALLPSGEPIRLRRSAAVAVYDVFFKQYDKSITCNENGLHKFIHDVAMFMDFHVIITRKIRSTLRRYREKKAKTFDVSWL